MIPNFSGWMGALQRWMNRPVFETHVPLSLEDLVAAYQYVGLENLYSSYWMTLNSGVLNIDTLKVGVFRHLLVKNFWRVLWVITWGF